MSLHLIKKHDYSLPSGHKRFIYRIDEDGFYRLETTRIESQEVTEQILTTSSQISSERTDNESVYSEAKASGHEISRIGEVDHQRDISSIDDDTDNVERNCCFSIVTHSNEELISDPIIVSIDDDKLGIPTGKVIISLPSPLN